MKRGKKKQKEGKERISGKREDKGVNVVDARREGEANKR